MVILTKNGGGASQDEVDNKILSHFSKHVPHLYFKIDEPPSIKEEKLWQNWISIYNKLDKKDLINLVSKYATRYGLNETIKMTATLNLEERDQKIVDIALVPSFFEEKLHEKVIEVLSKEVSSKLSRTLWPLYYRSLLALEKYDEILSLANKELEVDSKKVFDYFHGSFLALAYYKKKDFLSAKRSLKKISEKGMKEGLSIWISSLVDLKNNPDESFSNILKLLNNGRFSEDEALSDFESESNVLALFKSYFLISQKSIQIDKEAWDISISKNSKNEFFEITYTPIHLFLNQWQNSSEPLTRLRLQKNMSDLEEADALTDTLFCDEGEIWVSIKEGGFAKIIVENNKIIFQHRWNESRIDFLTSIDNFLFVVANENLQVFEKNSDSSKTPKKLTTISFHSLTRVKGITIDAQKLVATSGDIFEIYNISNPIRPVIVQKFSLSSDLIEKYFSCSYLVLKNNLLYLAIDNMGLLLFDISDNHPKIVNFVQIKDSFSNLWVEEDNIYIVGEESFYSLDSSNPSSLKNLQKLKSKKRYEFSYKISSTKSGPKFLLGDSEFFYHEIKVKKGKSPVIDKVYPIFKEGEKTDNLFYSNTILSTETGFLVVNRKSKINTLSFESMPLYKGWNKNIKEEVKVALRNWLKEQLISHSIKDNIVGIFMLECNNLELTLYLDGQQSITGISSGPMNQHDPELITFSEFRTTWNDLLGLPEEKKEKKGSDYSSTEDWELGLNLEERYQLFVDTMLELSLDNQLLKLVSGKAYIIRERYNSIVESIITCNGDWKPWRREIKEVIERSLSEILSNFETWNTYVERCNNYPHLKKEVHKLARTGDHGALQVVRRRFDIDEDLSIEVLLDVILNKNQYFWLKFLGSFLEREDVQKTYREVYEKLLTNKTKSEKKVLEWAGPLLEVSVVAKKNSTDETREVVNLLADDERVDYRHYDYLIGFFAAITKKELHLIQNYYLKL